MKDKPEPASNLPGEVVVRWMAMVIAAIADGKDDSTHLQRALAAEIRLDLAGKSELAVDRFFREAEADLRAFCEN